MKFELSTTMSARLHQQRLRNQRLHNRRLGNRYQRRHGSVLVYFALGLTAFIGTAALVVDVGSLYNRKSNAQMAADAAALAGAYQKAHFNDTNATAAALTLARKNGYDSNKAGVQVVVTNPVPGEPNKISVRTSRIEPLMFANIFGLRSTPVSATAIAQYSTSSPLSINGGGVYGQPDGPTTLSMFGPDGLHSYGDYRSTRTLTDGALNPEYTGLGYDFIINVPTTLTNTTLEIFDPDCYNADGVADAAQGLRVDELRLPNPTGGSGTLADATTTRYTLYWDPTGRGDRSQYQVIGSPYTVGADPATDMQWYQAFSWDRSLYTNPGGRFVMNATTLSGSSENGFTLRAGPPRAPGVTFDPDNGTSIYAEGHVPLNFNGNGTTKLELGKVPIAAAGKQLTIRKFDTDVGSQTVTYTCDTLPGAQFTGVLSGNDEFATDTIALPGNYQGGTWYAEYAAANQDTSVWEMSYLGIGLGKPGPIQLVN